ncbi:Wzz/FepE/Etk N-terminal domain-containing protein [Massilimicrobiota sp. An134]|uniref:YveK family protein n=1 Tax=Massilimicrobiota sp. An134 TaxID=1965557 RepID=UPI000B39FB19|nr:Wzz/FepE/Etk N-terminal domain-containing protein [Massilimicrobiota sp. An134]OUQ30362.1 hypothetical protein B5E79_03685 [Massilimicrobiota sp. An134]
MNKEIINEDQEVEIDLKALFLKMKALWYILVMGVLIGAIVMTLYSVFLKTPTYTSTAQIYLRGSSKSVSVSDLQLSTALSNDYLVLFKRRDNMQKVINELNLEMTPEQLKGMINISNISDTRILQVSVTSTDPELSRDIANSAVEQGMDDIREIDSQEPYMVEKAIASSYPNGSSTLKMTVLGALAGLVIAMGAIFIKFVLSDNVQSVDDIENTIGVPVLAVVVEDKALNYTKKKYSTGK